MTTIAAIATRLANPIAETASYPGGGHTGSAIRHLTRQANAARGIPTNQELPMPRTNKEIFEDELLGRLYYLKNDCDLIATVIKRDGPQYNNLELFQHHLREYQKIIDEFSTLPIS